MLDGINCAVLKPSSSIFPEEDFGTMTKKIYDVMAVPDPSGLTYGNLTCCDLYFRWNTTQQFK